MTTYYVDGAVGNDSNAGTSPGSGNAWATIAHALGAIAAGDLVYVKASATYSIGTGLTASVGIYNAVTRLVGYTATPGDGGRATIRATAAIVGVTISATGLFYLENFILDGNSTGSQGISFTGPYGNGVINCLIENWTGEGIVVGASSIARIVDTEVTGCAGTVGAVATGAASVVTIEGCAIHGNAASGIYSSANGYATIVVDCRIYGNTGPSSDGIRCDNYPLTAIGNTIHGNGRDGIRLVNYNIAGTIRNNIYTNNGGYGLNSPNSPAAVDPAIDYNWFGSGLLANTAGDRDVIQAGPHDASGDPQYANAATGDFTPGNAAVQAGSP